MSISDSEMERIEATISMFYEAVSVALSTRLKPWGEYETSRGRAESMGEQMVDVANLSVDIEEKLVNMLLMQATLQSMWEEESSKHLSDMSKLPTQQYVSKDAKLSGVIQSNRKLFLCKQRVDAAVEAGRRSIDRLGMIQSVASRVVSITYGSG